MTTKRCRDCGHSFNAPDRDLVLCPDCARALMGDDEGADFDAEYGVLIQQGWQRVPSGSFPDELDRLTREQRQRLFICKWPPVEGQ